MEENNPSGIISVQVIDKSSGKYKPVKMIGSSSDIKEVERQLVEKNAGLSPEKAIDTAKTIYCIKVITPKTKEVIFKHLYLTDE